MKKYRTNYWGLLVVTVIASGLTIFLVSRTNFLSQSLVVTNNINKVKAENTLKVRIGNLEVSYPYSLIDKIDEGNRTRFIFKKLTFLVNDRQKYAPAYFNITYSKDVNKEELPIAAWLDEGGIQYPPQAPLPYNEENFTRNGIQFHRHSIFGMNPQGYELVETSFAFSKDIYTIEHYSIPKSNTQEVTLFSQNDLNQAKSYEKVVDQILSSIHFIN
jgi:hypothetical protein